MSHCSRRACGLRVAHLAMAPSLRAPAQTRRPRLDGIEQRPVAFRQHMPFRERRAQLQPERAQHAVVAVVALQDDAGERRRRPRRRWRGIPSPPPRVWRRRARPAAFRRGARCGRALRAPFWCRGRASPDVGLDRGVVGAGHIVFVAGGIIIAGDGAQIVALRRGERLVRRIMVILNRRDWRGAASSGRRCRARGPGWWRSG